MPYRTAILTKKATTYELSSACPCLSRSGGCGAVAPKDYFAIVSFHNSPVGLAESSSLLG